MSSASSIKAWMSSATSSRKLGVLMHRLLILCLSLMLLTATTALAREQSDAPDIEHEEFHPLAKWDDFIADPGRYLNGMIEGEFEE